MRDAPDFFWYYNNGITAITRDLPRRINATAQQIEVTGFQIINGAQTVYSVYKAYRDAKNGKRNTINSALLQLRLVQSVNKEFDLDITRYTNQQNPTEPRDFWANDPVQIRLQNESFATNYWYSIRRGEFREVPKNVKIVSNKEFIKAYFRYFNIDADVELIIWSSQKEHNLIGFFQGEYEKYFNNNTKFEDLLIAYRLQEEIALIFNVITYSGSSFDASEVDYYSLLSEMRIVLTEIYGKNLNPQVLSKLNKKSDFFYKIMAFILEKREQVLNSFDPDVRHVAKSGLNAVSDLTITEEDIEKIDSKTFFGM